MLLPEPAPIFQPSDVPEFFADGVAHIERAGGECLKIWYFANRPLFRPAGEISTERQLSVVLIRPISTIQDSMAMIASAIATRKVVVLRR